jgi:hypothetical protein
MKLIILFYLAPAIDNGRQLAPSNTSTVLALPKARTTSLSDLSLSSGVAGSSVTLPLTIPPLVNEDIRLCTINRADALDIFGLELAWHCRKRFHSLSIISGRDNGPSSKTLLLSNYFLDIIDFLPSLRCGTCWNKN